MSSGPKKSSMSFPPDFRIPGPDAKPGARKEAPAPAITGLNSTYYRQGVLVPGGPPVRAISRNRPR